MFSYKRTLVLLYFMHKAILRDSDFLHGQAGHLWCVTETMGQPASLLARATPIASVTLLCEEQKPDHDFPTILRL